MLWAALTASRTCEVVANARCEPAEAPCGAAGAFDVEQPLRTTAATAIIAADDRNAGVTMTPRCRERVLTIAVTLAILVLNTPRAQ